jgi:L-ribulokinase
MSTYSLGLDYGTSSVRALLVNTNSGEEVAAASHNYPHGHEGVITSPNDPNLARQHPADYAAGAEFTIQQILKESKIPPEQIIGIGVDATGSTPIPVDENARPLALQDQFKNNPNAHAWLWKDHTAHEEAARITAQAKQHRPHLLDKCGGTYSSEWFWSKILHCAEVDPEVSAAAHTWLEQSDYIPAMLTGATGRGARRNICAAGHKAMATDNTYPDAEFLNTLHPELARIRQSLPDHLHTIADIAGTLSPEWSQRTGLAQNTPVAAGAIDAHLGAVGAGIQPNVLVKIIGTSTCDMMTAPLAQILPDIPGLCGVVPGSILPDAYGLEAGQSAVGDIFNWFSTFSKIPHDQLTVDAAKLAPAQSGLLALDWHNGNRTILIDQRLTGLVLGLTLHTTPAEIYRALIEATAFGARIIIQRLEDYGVKVARVINAGGIAAKNPLIMQIYADILNRPIEIARSTQTCALGAAIAGAVAGKARGGHPTIIAAIQAMTGSPIKTFHPTAKHVPTYERLYQLYTRLHDSFGVPSHTENLADLMKQLLTLRDQSNTR